MQCWFFSAHVYSLDMRSGGRLPLNQQIFLPHFKKSWRSSPLINSQKEKRKKEKRLARTLWCCGSPRRCLQSPSLQLGFKKWGDREAGCKQILMELPGFSGWIILPKDHHVLIFKGLSFLETPVFMMCIIWSVIKVKTVGVTQFLWRKISF